MALENKICDECEKLRLILIEKNNEIEKLKLHIQNLTNYLLCKDNNHEIQQNVHDPTFTGESIENTMVEQFYSNELFFKSCDRLNKHALLKSKSVQTDNSGKFCYLMYKKGKWVLPYCSGPEHISKRPRFITSYMIC